MKGFSFQASAPSLQAWLRLYLAERGTLAVSEEAGTFMLACFGVDDLGS